jgi:hypothetical protein
MLSDCPLRAEEIIYHLLVVHIRIAFLPHHHCEGVTVALIKFSYKFLLGVVAGVFLKLSFGLEVLCHGVVNFRV